MDAAFHGDTEIFRTLLPNGFKLFIFTVYLLTGGSVPTAVSNTDDTG
jgi:hypothetical protein